MLDRRQAGQDYTNELHKARMELASSSKVCNRTQPGPATVSCPTTDTNSDDEVRVGLGGLVAIVLSSSTPVQPLVELGQVLHINSDCTKFCYRTDIYPCNHNQL